jgi:cytochrome c oxidase assembly protein subunit 15
MVTLTAAIYAQMLLGAWMRHSGAGLAIPDFPLMFGHALPPVWTPAIALHFAHRLGALIVTALVLLTVVAIWRRHGDRPELVRPSWLLVMFVATQVTLGALVVLSGKQPVINTLHVATGGLVLVTSVLLTLRMWRIRFDGQRA